MSKSIQQTLLWASLIVLGFVYWYTHAITFTSVEMVGPDGNRTEIILPYEAYSTTMNERFVFELNVFSYIDQKKKIHITADDEILSIHANQQFVDFATIKSQYKQQKLKDYRRGYDFLIPLLKGKNTIFIETKNYGAGGYTLKAEANLFYYDYLILFFLILLPLVLLLVSWLDRYMPDILHFFNTRNCQFDSAQRDRLLALIPFGVVLFGIIIRVAYFWVYGHGSYQHDQHYHIEFIKYFSEFWSLPLPDKALEYPQQPLYYLVAGKLFALLHYFGVDESRTLMLIASLSAIMMIAILPIAYATVKMMTPSRFITIAALGFLAFTPSFVFLSGQINNDPLNFFLASVAIYYSVKYYFSGNSRAFFGALLFTVLVFMTKVSSGMIAILLFAILLYRYFNALKRDIPREMIVRHLKYFGVVVLFFLGLSFLRVYLPSTGEFLFVNSGIFKGQEIRSLDFSYFFSFRIIDLLNEGQAYVYGRFEPVKQSFFTWQYATMLLGEYDYKRVMNGLNWNRAVYLFSLIYVVGIVAFIYYFKKIPLILKLMMSIVAVNQLLIINFAFGYPSVCNTDFRYNSPTLILWGFIISFGLWQFTLHHERMKNTVVILVGVALTANFFWLIHLLLLAKPNTIT